VPSINCIPRGIRELVSKLLANAFGEIANCLIRLHDLSCVTGYEDRIDQIIGRPCARGSSHRKTLINERGAGFAYKTGVPFHQPTPGFPYTTTTPPVHLFAYDARPDPLLGRVP
jgi:hypothetical protein